MSSMATRLGGFGRPCQTPSVAQPLHTPCSVAGHAPFERVFGRASGLYRVQVEIGVPPSSATLKVGGVTALPGRQARRRARFTGRRAGHAAPVVDSSDRRGTAKRLWTRLWDRLTIRTLLIGGLPVVAFFML